MKRKVPLKRTGGLKRTTGLKRSTPLGSASPLARGKPMKRAAPAAMSTEERDMAAAWFRAVCRTPAGKPMPCTQCGSTKQIEGHHAIEKQRLKKEAASIGKRPMDLVWDPDVGIPLCRACHAAHTSGMSRISGVRLPAYVFAFAVKHGLVHHLQRAHPW